MGLDITAHSIATPISEDEARDLVDRDRWKYPLDYSSHDIMYELDIIETDTLSVFAHAFDGVEVTERDNDNIYGPLVRTGGCSASSQTSYSGWSAFRNFLTGTLAVDKWQGQELGPHAKGLPFFDLVWFSDCDGVIFGEASARIAADFRAYDRADAWDTGEGRSWRQKYEHVALCFEVASGTGIAIFK